MNAFDAFLQGQSGNTHTLSHLRRGREMSKRDSDDVDRKVGKGKKRRDYCQKQSNPN